MQAHIFHLFRNDKPPKGKIVSQRCAGTLLSLQCNDFL